jgi:hypothetical protein
MHSFHSIILEGEIKRKGEIMSKIKWIPLILLMVFLCLWSVINKPKLYGDGQEYLLMSISFSNHLTSNQIESDVEEWKTVLDKNNFGGKDNSLGYFEDLKGNWYSYHFWFYSLLCTPIYLVLKLLHMNELKMFQIANIILMGFAIYTLITSKMDRKQKIWMLIGLINPIWLYVPWSHPEVFTFVLLFISLIKWAEKKPVLAALFSAIASWQNPGAAIFTAFVSIKAIIETFTKRKITKSFILTGLSASLVLFPYIWYWVHYNTFSLVGETYTGSLSIEKAVSLFLDPNFGMFWYIPVLMLCLGYRLFKRDRKAILALCLLLIIALICSVQLNWNSGSTWVNRYAVWMIPIVIYGTFNITRRWVWGATAIVQGGILILCLTYFNDYSYTKFTPLAKTVMTIAPGMYNPPFEVFIERSIGREVSAHLLYESNTDEVKTLLPINIVTNGTRKTLDNEMNYINNRLKLDWGKPAILFLKSKNEDINKGDMSLSFDGFYGLENWNAKNARWMTGNAKVFFLGQQGTEAQISFLTGSFHRTRNALIRFNGEVVFNGEISTDQQEISFKKTLSEVNIIEIKTNEEVLRNMDIPEYKGSNDQRRLAFYMMDLSVN